MNRISIAGATLALAGLGTAGVLVATNPASQVSPRATALAASTILASPQLMTFGLQDRRENAQAAREAAAAAARKAAAVRAAAARAAAVRAAVLRAAAARAAALRAAAARRVEATRAAAARASRSSVRAPIQGPAPVYSGDARGIARSMLAAFGWSATEFSCLDPLWSAESGWRVGASNPSGAYGIPQALPGSKMGAYGSDWQSNPRTQITWGLHYIQGRYGSPCAAWAHFQSYGWY